MIPNIDLNNNSTSWYQNDYNFFVSDEQNNDSKKIEFKSERPLHITMASLDTSIECNYFFKLFILYLVKFFNYFR